MTERELFEVWAQRRGFNTNEVATDELGEFDSYKNDATQDAWDAWDCRASIAFIRANAGSEALRDVADAVCKQFACAGIKPLLGSMNPAEDLHARAMKALGKQPPMDGSRQ